MPFPIATGLMNKRNSSIRQVLRKKVLLSGGIKFFCDLNEVVSTISIRVRLDFKSQFVLLSLCAFSLNIRF